ncbi:MAG: hypothetical protein LBJ01_01715 [Tannerella sp.]|jgi:hypothetical protein|nr:hypothetical protein [Tannerella sp.]
MKKRLFLKTLASVTAAITLGSCDRAEDSGLSLHEVENHAVLQLYYPPSVDAVLSIIGGDGTYAAASSDESVLKATTVQEQKTLVLTPLSPGEATVTLSDGANNVYTLSVNISFRESSFVIKERAVRIRGGNLTEEEKKDIEAKALATVPVQVNGGYRFTFTNEDGYSGKVTVYAETFGENGEEGVFEMQVEDENSAGHIKYVMRLNGRERIFHLATYDPSTRTSPKIDMVFAEDVTGLIQPDYPDVELVYTEQIF